MKKISFLLLEIVLVIVVITILILFGAPKLLSKYPQYTAEFKDINGLSIGSPVRIAGLHVGHVTKQELKGDKILITFKITEDNLDIPKGSTAGVEFTGLAGSRSLELYPPKVKLAYKDHLHTVEPVRANSLLEIQRTVVRTTVDFLEGVLSFVKKNEKTLSPKLKKTATFFKEKASTLDKTNEVLKEKAGATVQETKELKDLIKGTCDNVAVVQDVVNDLVEDKEIQERIEKIKSSAEKLNNLVKSGEAEKKLDEINSKAKKLNKDLQDLNKKIDKVKNRELAYIKEFNDSLKSASEKMQKIIDSSEKKLSSDK